MSNATDVFIGHDKEVNKEEWEKHLINGKIGMQSGRNDAIYCMRGNVLYRVSFSGSVEETSFSKLGINKGVKFYIINELQVTLLSYIEKNLRK